MKTFNVFELIDASRAELPASWYLTLGVFRQEFERLYDIEACASVVIAHLVDGSNHTKPFITIEDERVQSLARACGID